ncbi:unnamed protein product [Enterobius vermicularis]|uniref:Ig-like domain-containing protein n=1 Tax=Enterobius vermicularis TaxID=51028 RepID=A0A0N4VQQ4_ENTVE|nr:unnamed protein product [Enterobius vermicularis]
MAPPSIYGEPKITHDTASGSVFLDVIVTGVIPAKTKWFFGDKELDKSETYVFSSKDEGGKRTLLRCEIKRYHLISIFFRHFFFKHL